jgi:tetratricopeptide (TPR) repeat protein
LSKDVINKIRLKYNYVFHSELTEILTTVNDRALSMIRSGHIDHAVSTLRDFLELCDFTPVLHYNLGLLYLNQGHLKEALRVAWRAAELDPDYLESYDLAANVLYRIGDFERSLHMYHEVVRIDPDDAQGYYNIGLANWAMGKYEEAERFWSTAIQKDRKAKKAKLDRSGESEDLVHSLTVELFPVSFDAHRSLGALYDKLGKKEKALQEFVAALEYVPNDSECYYYLGKIHHEMGNTEKAISNLERCVYLGTKWEKEAADILEKIKKDSE